MINNLLENVICPEDDEENYPIDNLCGFVSDIPLFIQLYLQLQKKEENTVNVREMLQKI